MLAAALLLLGCGALPPGARAAAPALDAELAFEAGSAWESAGYPALCRGAAGPGEGVGADSMPIAWHSRRANTTYLMSADHRRMFAATGPNLDTLRGCTPRRVLTSFNASTPQSYANFQWLQSVRVFANGTAAGLVHNEFKGEFPADTGSEYCSRHCADSSNWNWRGCRDQICEIWSTGLASSADAAMFELAAAPPRHLVAALPHRYVKDQPISGYGAISNGLQRGADGGFYGLVNVVNRCVNGSEAQRQRTCGATPAGNCVFRAGSLFDPASFRARDAAGDFTVPWASAYTAGGLAKGACATIPVTEESHFGEHVSFRKVLPPPGEQGQGPAYIALGDTPSSAGSVKYSLSHQPDFGAAMRDINASWTAPKLLALDLPGGVQSYHYPTLLDVRSPELGAASGTVEALEDGDSYALVSYPHPLPAGSAPAPAAVEAVRVEGSGCSECNGLYHSAPVPPGFGSASHFFKLDATHALYLNDNVWHIARLGKQVFYASSAPASPGGGPPANGWAAVTGPKPAPRSVVCERGAGGRAVSSLYVYLRGAMGSGQLIMRRRVQLLRAANASGMKHDDLAPDQRARICETARGKLHAVRGPCPTGQSVHVAGVNIFDLFFDGCGGMKTCCNSQGGRASCCTYADSLHALETAHASGIRVLRFFAHLFGAAQTYWLTNEAEYWQSMDRLMDDVERLNLRAIPSLGNSMRAVANALHPGLNETLNDAIRNASSVSFQLTAKYFRQFVARYKGREGVLLWELGTDPAQ